MNDDELKALFLGECAEMLDGVPATLAACGASDNSAEAWNSLYRAAHTIKGSSGLLGFPAVCAFAETLETFIGEIRRGERPGDRNNLASVEAGFAMLAAHVDVLTGGVVPDDRDVRARLAPLSVASTSAPVDPVAGRPGSLSFDLDDLIGTLDAPEGRSA